MQQTRFVARDKLLSGAVEVLRTDLVGVAHVRLFEHRQEQLDAVRVGPPYDPLSDGQE